MLEFSNNIAYNIIYQFIIYEKMNFTRTLAPLITKASSFFKVIMIFGPRQVGKTTLLKSIMEKDRSYVTFDNIETRLSAKEDPAKFIQDLKLPVLIDEVQYVPELFPYIKYHVDKSDQKGLFWLTVSCQFNLIKNITESLAVRVGIFRLQGISNVEETGNYDLPPFTLDNEQLENRKKCLPLLSSKEVYSKIWRGQFPAIVSQADDFWEIFYSSYLTTYLERDILSYLGISDLVNFRKFMQILASRTSQMVNYRDISKEIGISEPTVKNWVNILEASGIIVLLPPYFNNISKRLIKTPKLYFLDTGLCAYLCRWLNPEVLENGAMSGAFLETYVISQIIFSYWHNGKSTHNLYYYRDKDNNEVDLIIEQNGEICPIEIKKNVSVSNTNFNGFKFLNKYNITLSNSCLLNLGHEIYVNKDGVKVFPVSYL